MRRHVLPLLLAATCLLGCIPDLSPWRVVPVDFDAGPRRPDAQVITPTGCSEGALPIGAGYREGFEAGPAGWVVTGDAPSWELGTPAGENVIGAGEGTQAWITLLDAPYPPNEESHVLSPCFDASGSSTDLLLELRRAYDTESNYDKAIVEFSLDDGETWAVASGESRLGWYPSQAGWSGSGAWALGSVVLPGTAGQPEVRVRVRWRSDGSQDGDGFAFDDVSLRPLRTDLAATISESERCGFMTVEVANIGGAAVTGFELTSVIDGVSEVDTYDSAFRYRDTRRFEIGGPLARTFSSTVFVPLDADASNDSVSATQATRALGGGYFSDFEADDGGLVVAGSNATWAWGTPAGTLINTAASGSRAWVTNLSGNYASAERSTLSSPCFDLRGTTRDPQLSFQQVFRTEARYDYAYVEVSVDGANFSRLGSTSSGGTNWYSSSNGWDGTSGSMGAWRTAQHPLTNAGGHEFVRFRFRMFADGGEHYEGFGLDDLALIP